MINHKIFPTADAVVKSLADDMLAYSQQGQPVHISLSGGSTPKMLFKLLASQPYANDIQWQNLHFWWGDERCVAPDDAQSNYGEANALLFSKINMPAQNIHRILGENEPQAEAERFAQAMAHVIPTENGTPVFDWILLGVGADGHTASLFPGKLTMQTPIFRWSPAIQNLGNYAFQKPRKCCKQQNASVISFLAQVKPRS